eukprot:530491-Rhodomonas_salina.1
MSSRPSARRANVLAPRCCRMSQMSCEWNDAWSQHAPNPTCSGHPNLRRCSSCALKLDLSANSRKRARSDTGSGCAI